MKTGYEYHPSPRSGGASKYRGYSRARRHRAMPNFYLIGRVLGHVILFFGAYFALLTIRIIFNF